MSCPECKKDVNMLLAVFWNGSHWHRSCAVMRQKKEIVKIEKKLASSSISQIHHAEQKILLEDSIQNLKCLIKVNNSENEDAQKLGKIMIRHGFGERVDTHHLLEVGELSQKQIKASQEIKRLFGYVENEQ